MTWSDIRRHHPHQWLLIEALLAHSKEGKRLLDELAVVGVFPDGETALRAYLRLHRAAPMRELYVVHSDREDLQITERFSLGPRTTGFEVPPELEAELVDSIAEADRGETIPAEELIERLRRIERRDPLVDNPALAEAVRMGWITPAEIVSDEPPPRLPVTPLRELLQELDEDRADR